MVRLTFHTYVMSRLSQINKIAFFSLLLFIIKAHSQLNAQIIPPIYDKLYNNNVVQITSKFSDGTDVSGFGFVMHETDNFLHIVTAKHVCYSSRLRKNPTKILVKFHKGYQTEQVTISRSTTSPKVPLCHKNIVSLM